MEDSPPARKWLFLKAKDFTPVALHWLQWVPLPNSQGAALTPPRQPPHPEAPSLSAGSRHGPQCSLLRKCGDPQTVSPRNLAHPRPQQLKFTGYVCMEATPPQAAPASEWGWVGEGLGMLGFSGMGGGENQKAPRLSPKELILLGQGPTLCPH